MTPEKVKAVIAELEDLRFNAYGCECCGRKESLYRGYRRAISDAIRVIERAENAPVGGGEVDPVGGGR